MLSGSNFVKPLLILNVPFIRNMLNELCLVDYKFIQAGDRKSNGEVANNL